LAPIGNCWGYTYNPLMDAAAPFAGVGWQYPANYWGTAYGRVIPPGATKVHFYAWGAAGGEDVKFEAGNNTADGLPVSTTVKLTATPKAYDIVLPNTACKVVGTAFAWYFAGAVPITFYVDNIEWQ
jgi:hypothetical protein